MPLPERDEMFNTRGKMLQNIIVSLGGRIAEELVLMILPPEHHRILNRPRKLPGQWLQNTAFHQSWD